jgi:hypothetical protein
MGTFMEKLNEFFSEPENYLPGAEPIDFKGLRYIPYTAREDKDSVWPNVFCSRCGRLELKKKMFFNIENGSFLHPDCISGEGRGETHQVLKEEKEASTRKRKGKKSPSG